MYHPELQEIQAQLRYDGPSMAALLGIDYGRYRNYRSGHVRIPAELVSRIRRLVVEDQRAMARVRARISQRLEQDFPGGIPSAGNDYLEVEHGD